MVKYIDAAATLPLRSSVLRKGAPLEQCIFPTDDIEGSFHLGYFVEGRLVSISTYYPADYEGQGEGGYRLRGMATDAGFLGNGYGSALIKFAINELRSAKASYIWCDARSAAVEFYKKLGFKSISAAFEIPGIGPHFKMIKIIQ